MKLSYSSGVLNGGGVSYSARPELSGQNHCHKSQGVSFRLSVF